ncbi:hypothetical protein GRJ2_003236400 [Grus japonensis]|uniref:Uncharacterized protein n=1 Tax=Grus japonensis TaxID=30415 RepID=A0ABC9YDP6_GRUJA
MVNKQEKLEATVMLESYDLVTINETWWDESHDWSVAIDSYKLFRSDRRGRMGGGIALYVKKWIDCEELSLKNSHKQVESLWEQFLQPERGVRICERNNYADTKVSAEGDAPGASGEIPLQPMEKIMVRQAVPLQPMEVDGGADICLKTVENPRPEQVDA